MSDGQGSGSGGAAAAALAGAGAGGGQQQGQEGQQGQQNGGQQQGQEGQQGGGQQRSWRDLHLPEDMRADATLGRFDSVEALAKSHLELFRFANDRVAVPKDEATFKEFASKVRPEKADGYTFEGIDGLDMDRVNGYRDTFHELGLHPMQAQGLAKAQAQMERDAMSRIQQENKNGLIALEVELGQSAYNQRLEATGNMLEAIGLGKEFIDALEATPGSNARKTMEALFSLADKTGELAKVDGATVQANLGRMSAADAQKELDRMDSDKATRDAVQKNPQGPEAQKRNLLMDVLRKNY